MRLPIILFLLLYLNISCSGQGRKEQEFKATVKEVIIAFSNQDSAKVVKFINKKIGLYQLDRVGAFNHYNHYSTISFSDTAYPQVLFRNSRGIQLLSLKYAKLPIWDCDKGVWSKIGLFVDTTKTDHLLSRICRSRNKYAPDSISNKIIRYFYNIESKSRRIVLFDNNKKELVFYLSYLNNKWFLTIVDNVSSDCSA